MGSELPPQLEADEQAPESHSLSRLLCNTPEQGKGMYGLGKKQSTEAVGRPHLRSHCQGHIMQPRTEDLRVTSCQALDVHQAFLLHLPEKQGQACHRRGGGRCPVSLQTDPSRV